MRPLALALLTLLLTGCTSLVFQPSRQALFDPTRVGIHPIDDYFTTADGLRLHAWRLPAEGKVKGNVILLHGNAQNITTHIGSVYWMPHYGFNVYLFDYRGYGSSQGEPTLPGLQLDFQAALARFDATRGNDQGIVVFGQSLGSLIAITGLARMTPAQKRDVCGLVVEGAFTSLRSVAREDLAKFWLTWPFQWPLSFTVSDRYRPVDDIAKLKGLPILIVHSHADQVIPFREGQELFAAAQPPKQFWAVDHAKHIEAFNDEKMRERLAAYLDGVFAGCRVTAP